MDALDRYAAGGHRKVQGWLEPVAIQLIRAAAQAQGCSGPVCEIGVHHGRLFLLLHLLDPGQKAVAIDLYEDQAQNVDGSGSGDSSMLDRNLAEHGGRLGSVAKVFANSLTLSSREIIDRAGGPIRIFSVDGGHTAQITANDLALAEASVMEGGIVILDDYFNPAWPDVSVGTCQYFAQPRALIPFAIGGNKVLLVKGQGHAASLQAAVDRMAGCMVLQKEMFGHPVRTILERADPSWSVRQLIPRPARRAIRKVIGYR
jgi:hypothetical protein